MQAQCCLIGSMKRLPSTIMAVCLQGEAKEEMMLAMGLNTEEEGSAMAFLRRGYKARLLHICHSCKRFSCVLQCMAG